MLLARVITRFAGIMAMVGLFTGCAAQQVRERYFWPPPPDTPRVEWLGAYQNEQDLKPKGGLLELVVGDMEQFGLERPTYISADGKGKVFVSDYKLQGFVVFDLNARTVHMLGGQKSIGLFDFPSGLAIDNDGSIYAADSNKRKIFVLDRNENYTASLDLSKELTSIASIAIDKQRKHLIVPDVKGQKVVIYDIATRSIIKTLGREVKDIPNSDPINFNYPTSAAVDAKGNFWICDSMNARVIQFSPEGKQISEFGQRGDALGDFAIIKAAAIDSEGHLYVTDGKAHRISIFNEKGEVLLVFGGPYALKGVGSEVRPGGFLLPNGIYIDQNDTIYIVDQMNGRFQVYQYVTERYLKEHPITDQAPAAKAKLKTSPAASPVPSLDSSGAKAK